MDRKFLVLTQTTLNRNFFPTVGQAITELSVLSSDWTNRCSPVTCSLLQVPVIYAQDGAGVDYNKAFGPSAVRSHAAPHASAQIHMSSNAELERFWSGMKARAIARL